MALPRTARFAIAGMLVLVGIVAAAAILLPRVLDVNRYRPLIVEKVRQATGRTVELGEISLKILPIPSLEVERIAVSEGDRYPDADALKTDSLSIRVGLLPLVRGQVAINSVVLDSPSVNLIRDEQGRWNFEDLVSRAKAATPPSKPAENGMGITAVIERAVVRSARIHVYDDAIAPGSRTKVTIGPIDAVLKGWGADQETEIDLSVQLGSNFLEARGRLLDAGSSPRLEAEAQGQALKADELTALLPWLGIARPDGMEMSGEVDLDGTAELPLDKPEAIRFNGSVRLRNLSYRDASMTRPFEGISGTLSVNGDRAEWDDFNAKLGDSSLRGQLQVEDFLHPRIGFRLTSPKLDLNELLAAFAAGSSAAGAPESVDADEDGAGPGLLDQVKAQGTLEITAVRFQTFDLSNVRASGGLDQGVLSLTDMQSGFYSGRLAGAASADLRDEVPKFTLGVRLQEVDLDPLLTAYDPELAGLLKGRLSGTLEVGASGMSMDAIMGSARGDGKLEVADGTLASFSVLRFVAAFLETAGGKGIGRNETPFEFLRGTLSIADGKARTEDLTLHSADLELAGDGWVGLDAALDLNVQARFSAEATDGMLAKNPRVGALTDPDGRLALHFNLDGSLADPKFKFRATDQLRAIRNSREEKLKQKTLDRLKDVLREQYEEQNQQQKE
jgi:AsmA protein